MARVMVVDDDPDIRVAIAEALKIAGYDVSTAATGAGAVASCREHCPDLVLLDQMLPDIDGLEVCRRLRDDPATARVPTRSGCGSAGRSCSRRSSRWRWRCRKSRASASRTYCHCSMPRRSRTSRPCRSSPRGARGLL